MVPEKVNVLLLILALFFGYCFILGAIESIVNVYLVHPAKIFKNMEHFSVECFNLFTAQFIEKPQLIEIAISILDR